MERKGHGRRIVLAAAALMVVVGGAASAAIPGGGGVISGCYGKSSGILRVIDAEAGGGPEHGNRLQDQRGRHGLLTPISRSAGTGGALTEPRPIHSSPPSWSRSVDCGHGHD